MILTPTDYIIEWHYGTSFRQINKYEENDNVKWIMQFTVHSKSRAPLKKPTLEITKHNRFKKEKVKNIDKEKHRYEVKLVLTKVRGVKSQMRARFRAQLFTSVKADFRQDINRGFAFIFSRCLNGFGKLTQKRRFVFVTLPIWVNVPMS